MDTKGPEHRLLFDGQETNNPTMIPRKAEEAFSAAKEGSDFNKLQALLQVLSKPDAEKREYTEFRFATEARIARLSNFWRGKRKN